MKIERLIKEKNIKLTPARLELVEIFDNATKPLCYEDIKERLSMDKATFYRNISKFEQEGILSAFESNDKKRYFEIKHDSHAHFVCVSCNEVQCMDEVEITLPSHQINNVVISGTCPECSEDKE